VRFSLLIAVIRPLAWLYLVAVAFLAWGIAIARFEVFPFRILQPVFTQADQFAHDPRSFAEKLTQHPQVQRNRFSYTGLKRRDAEFRDTGYLLLSRFSQRRSQVIVELMRLSDGSTLHTWIPPLDEILARGKAGSFDDPKDTYRTQHPLLLADGSLVFSSGEGPLVRIDKHSKLVWLLPEHFHHSIEMDHQGNLVVPIWNKPSLTGFEWMRDDGFAVVSAGGEVIKRHSVGSILMRNGYTGLYLGVDEVSSDRIHLNDAQPIRRDAGMARIGDVALSSRTLSTVFLYRPSADKVVWLKTGPWLCQHDVNLVETNTYSIFGNDVYCRGGMFGDELFGDSSQVYLFDPTTQQVRMPYAEVLKLLKVRSVTSGRSSVLPNGDVFVEESEANRLLRVSPHTVRWEYVNGESPQWSGALHWCRYLESDEIKLSWLE
jgi:hypothetical protein